MIKKNKPEIIEMIQKYNDNQMLKYDMQLNINKLGDTMSQIHITEKDIGNDSSTFLFNFDETITLKNMNKNNNNNYKLIYIGKFFEYCGYNIYYCNIEIDDTYINIHYIDKNTIQNEWENYIENNITISNNTKPNVIYITK